MPGEELVSAFFASMNGRDLEALEGFLDEGAQFHFPKTGPLLGRERILKFFRLLFRRFPRLDFTIRRTLVQGEWAAVHWTNDGITRKEEAYRNEGVTLLHVEKGKIRYMSDFFKDTEKF